MDKVKGFTLLELLIVISIIAIFSAILIYVLNPAEILKRVRDSQRISDLKTLHRAIGVYITTVSDQDLDTWAINCDSGVSTECSVTIGGDGVLGSQTITGNNMTPGSACSDTNLFTGGQDVTTPNGGWVAVDFTNITGGSPISKLPLDPRFSVANLADPNENDFFYMFACGENPLKWEFIANLESKNLQFNGSEDKESTDGGDSFSLYEVGSNLNLITWP